METSTCNFKWFSVSLINREPSFQFNDHWVGLRSGQLPNCTCELENMLFEDCERCRESWVWADRVPMTHFAWRNVSREEPGLHDCGRLNALGWADMDCDYTFKYICEKYTGEYTTVINDLALL